MLNILKNLPRVSIKTSSQFGIEREGLRCDQSGKQRDRNDDQTAYY